MNEMTWWEICICIIFLPVILIVLLGDYLWNDIFKHIKQPKFIRRGLIYLKKRMKPNLKIKCKKEDVESTPTRKEFLRLFLTSAPKTYFLNGKEQCRLGAHRSFSDLLALTQDRFPKTSEKTIIRIVAQLNIEGLCDIVWCNQVKKFVVRGRKQKPGIPFMTAFSVKYFENNVGEDGISYKHLIKVREKELVN